MTNDLLPDDRLIQNMCMAFIDGRIWPQTTNNYGVDPGDIRGMQNVLALLVEKGLVSTPNKSAEGVDWHSLEKILRHARSKNESCALELTNWIADNRRNTGHLATGNGGDGKASSGFKLTGEHVRQIMRSPAYWREKDPSVMKMVQECFEYLTEKDRVEIKSLEQIEQQKTAEPCGDVKKSDNAAPIVKNQPENEQSPPTQIDAGELERALIDVVDTQTEERWMLESLELKAKEIGGFCVRAGLDQFQLLNKLMPERFEHHKQEQQKLMEAVPNVKPFLRKTINGELNYITLAEYEELGFPGADQQELKFGGCGCFIDGGEK